MSTLSFPRKVVPTVELEDDRRRLRQSVGSLRRVLLPESCPGGDDSRPLPVATRAIRNGSTHRHARRVDANADASAAPDAAIATTRALRVTLSPPRAPEQLCELCELRELTYRYRTKTMDDGAPLLVAPRVGHTEDATSVVARLLENEAVEVMGLLCLTARNAVICWHEVGRGGLGVVMVALREIFKPAIMSNAATIILAHYAARYIMYIMWRKSLCDGSQCEPLNRTGRPVNPEHITDWLKRGCFGPPTAREEIVRAGTLLGSADDRCLWAPVEERVCDRCVPSERFAPLFVEQPEGPRMKEFEP